MELLKAVLLGILQGLTEFLPVSSSGHLVIGAKLLGFDEPGIAFEVFLHLGTLLAVVIVFRRELLRMIMAPLRLLGGGEKKVDAETELFFRWDIYIVVATIPAVIVGLFLKDRIEAIFSNILVTFTMLAVTSMIMVLTRFLKNRRIEINCPRAFTIGVAQSMAILPGLSRSGSTIFTGMLLGIDRETVARFSFIMSIPAILGAAVLQLGDLLASPPGKSEIINLAAGTLASGISGYGAIILLLSIVRRGRLHWFGYYCFFLSALGFCWYLQTNL